MLVWLGLPRHHPDVGCCTRQVREGGGLHATGAQISGRCLGILQNTCNLEKVVSFDTVSRWFLPCYLGFSLNRPVQYCSLQVSIITVKITSPALYENYIFSPCTEMSLKVRKYINNTVIMILCTQILIFFPPEHFLLYPPSLPPKCTIQTPAVLYRIFHFFLLRVVLVFICF